MSDKKLTLTARQVIQIWNTLHELRLVADFTPEFGNWSDVFIVYATDEVGRYDSLTPAQRALIQSGEISFPMGKIDAKFLPKVDMPRHYQSLVWIAKQGGQTIEKPKTQIEKLLELAGKPKNTKGK